MAFSVPLVDRAGASAPVIVKTSPRAASAGDRPANPPEAADCVALNRNVQATNPHAAVDVQAAAQTARKSARPSFAVEGLALIAAAVAAAPVMAAEAGIESLVGPIGLKERCTELNSIERVWKLTRRSLLAAAMNEVLEA